MVLFPHFSETPICLLRSGSRESGQARFEAKWEKEMAQHTSAGHSNHRCAP